MRRIAIIPARGGSKRIPRKNVRSFMGKPVIAYSIEAALASGVFDEVMVSTDDDEIAEVACRYGASVPFMRSADTAGDYATTAAVIREVLQEYSDKGREFDAFACIYATAPFVTPDRLREAFDRIGHGGIDSAFTVVPFSYPVWRGLVDGAGGRVVMQWPEYRDSRSQDLTPVYHDAGQFYVSTVAGFDRNGSLWGDNTAAIVLSELEVQDLDTETDWALAEMKYRMLHDVRL
ncbi:MAG: pseudaminic acid cytidylyltransferase [Muribaculaceae bacterium]|nr:pseudaminic acid cytidylyltransferase [Muribaculaceae bacterium]